MFSFPVGFPPSKQEASSSALARMVVEQQSGTTQSRMKLRKWSNLYLTKDFQNTARSCQKSIEKLTFFSLFPSVSPVGYLRWNMNHSVRKNINFFHNSWLTILEPGDYYVYSRVTFSKGNPQIPLASKVKLRKTESDEQKVVMMAYCSLSSSYSSESNPHMCTATQMDLITLEKGNQLSVWVPDLSLVDYEEGATTFGMYKV